MLVQPGVTIFVVFSVFLSLATITILLRTYVRTRLIRRFGFDDWTAFFGWLIFVALTADLILAVLYALDPAYGLPVVELMKTISASGPLYLASGMLVKFSIAAMLLRVATIQRVCRYVVIAAVVLYEVICAIVFVVVFVQCRPISYFWGRYRGDHGECAPLSVREGFLYLLAATTCLTDWVFAIIPWFLIRQLVSTNMRTKVMIAVVLSMSSIASIATIVRMPYIHGGFTAEYSNFLIWTYIELGLAITASSAATLKPLIVKVLPKSPSERIPDNPAPIQRSNSTLNLDFSYFSEQTTTLKSVNMEMEKFTEVKTSQHSHGHV